MAAAKPNALNTCKSFVCHQNQIPYNKDVKH